MYAPIVVLYSIACIGSKMLGYTCMIFCHFYKGDNFCEFPFTPGITKFFKMGSSLLGKNLLPEEQILSFKN